MVEVSGGNNGCPGCASILKYGSGDGFEGGYLCFVVFPHDVPISAL